MAPAIPAPHRSRQRRAARRRGLALALGLLALPALSAEGPVLRLDPQETAELRAIVLAMKENPRGPFSRIRWFCADGTVQEPRPFACADHGGGRQHGEWSEQTKRLHAAGFPVANVMVQLTADDFDAEAEGGRHLRMLVLEQFLVNVDDGWILRGARFYRGAFQVEAERTAAYKFLSGLARRPAWRERRLPLLMEAARLIPHGEDTPSHSRVRNLATSVHERDPGFAELRNKIHGRPDPNDAERVRQYARSRGLSMLADEYDELARAIDALHERPPIEPRLREFASQVRDPDLAQDLLSGATALEANHVVVEEVRLLAGLMARLRDAIGASGHPLDTIDLILALESEVFGHAQSLSMDEGRPTRARTLALMGHFAKAAYGSGLLTAWELENLEASFARLGRDRLALDDYRAEIAYLSRAPGWAARRLAFYFEPAVEELAQIEPLAREYIPDRMRGSPFLFYSRLLAPLSADAQSLAGVRQTLFGEEVATGLRALNPGIGRGVLRELDQLASAPEGTASSVALVPETVSELPVVAGILTEHEGNSLSHVQLLARNLGVPNVVVGDEHLPALRERLGQRVLIAASPGGVVRIELESEAAPAARPEPSAEERISIDVSRLDLETRRPIPVSELGTADQGVRVGPKAAQLGRLTRHFPDHVSDALAVPFGAFADALKSRRVEPGGPTLFEWMTAQYDALQGVEDPVEKTRRTRELLATVRGWFQALPPDPEKLAAFHEAVRGHFGPDGSYGVFVRSDTNVEDLPGFTGAGINLTVPNVVGWEPLVQAMRDVWASPFTERSFGWRQGIMNDPEHVYVSVLLHESVNADRSGVLITADVETGSMDWVTVVLNEGVGGGVEGQAAETLLIRRADGQVRLLGSATAPFKRVLRPTGGSELVPASGAERLLSPADVEQVLWLVDQLPGWFESLPPEERARTVADVEFGFLGDKLYLFQIRPFVQSKGAARSRYLQEMDAGLADTTGVMVDMQKRQGTGPVPEPRRTPPGGAL